MNLSTLSATEIIETAKWLHRPTEGEFACALWRWSNVYSDYDFAAKLMRDCGYVPFQGYPLTRARRTR